MENNNDINETIIKNKSFDLYMQRLKSLKNQKDIFKKKQEIKCSVGINVNSGKVNKFLNHKEENLKSYAEQVILFIMFRELNFLI